MVKLGSKPVDIIVEHGDDVTISLGRELRTVKRSELTFDNPCREISPPKLLVRPVDFRITDHPIVEMDFVHYRPWVMNGVRPSPHTSPCGEIALGEPQPCNLGVCPCELCGNVEVCMSAFQVVDKKRPYPIVKVCRGCRKHFCLPLHPKEVQDEN